MVEQVIKNPPEPIDETPIEGEEEEVKETEGEESSEEKETPEEPSTSEETTEEELGSDATETEEVSRQVQGLKEEKEKLLEEIISLRGERRSLKEIELKKVEEKLDELKDVHPQDVQVIERILKARGYLSKEEAQKMYYNQIKQQELTSFLNKYPEFKPENDPNDKNWTTLQKEMSYYRLPEDPHLIGGLLEKARKSIQIPVVVKKELLLKKQQLKVAGVGSGGAFMPSTEKSLTANQKAELSRGGFTEEEIAQME